MPTTRAIISEEDTGMVKVGTPVKGDVNMDASNGDGYGGINRRHVYIYIYIYIYISCIYVYIHSCVRISCIHICIHT